MSRQFQAKAVRRPVDVVEEEHPLAAIADMDGPETCVAAEVPEEEAEESEHDGNPVVDDDIDDALFDDPIVVHPDVQLDLLSVDPLPGDDDTFEPAMPDAGDDALEPAMPDAQAQLVAAPAVHARGGHVESRDHLQPPNCRLRSHVNKAGGCYWLGRGPKPERGTPWRSLTRTITATIGSDVCVGQIEAWLLLHYGS